MSEPINSFQDLRVYHEACELDAAVFEVSQGCPREEMSALAMPLRHAVRAVGAGIAGAWPKRRQPEEFVARLTDADSALQETRHWLGRAVVAGYLDAARHGDLEAGCDAIGRKLGTLIRQAGEREAGDRRPEAREGGGSGTPGAVRGATSGEREAGDRRLEAGGKAAEPRPPLARTFHAVRRRT